MKEFAITLIPKDVSLGKILKVVKELGWMPDYSKIYINELLNLTVVPIQNEAGKIRYIDLRSKLYRLDGAYESRNAELLLNNNSASMFSDEDGIKIISYIAKNFGGLFTECTHSLTDAVYENCICNE